MQKVSTKGYWKGVLVQEGGGLLCRKGSRKGPGRVFPYKKGGSFGVPGIVPGQEGGGVPVQEGGSSGVPVVLLVHILPSHFLAGFHFKCNAKGRHKFPWQSRSSDPVLESGG